MGTLYRNDRPYGASIEKVPTKISDLRNDMLYQTKSQVENSIELSISPIQNSINTEITNRINGDNSLQENIDTLQSYINELQTKLDNLKSLVPTQASSTNQLADKNFVNSSISTNTSNFIGTFNTLEELESQSATNNDYAFWKTLDTDGNVLYKRYKFVSDDNTWQFEYDLNNSSFTSEQWNTINSGLTKDYVDTKVLNEETQRIESDKNINVTESEVPKHIRFTNYNGVSTDIPIGGDTDSQEITQDEYDELSEEEKDSDTIYFIKDSDGFNINFIDDDYIREETTWSSEKINNELNDKETSIKNNIPTKVSQLTNDSGFINAKSPFFSAGNGKTYVEQGYDYLVTVTGGAQIWNIYGLYFVRCTRYGNAIVPIVTNGAISSVGWIDSTHIGSTDSSVKDYRCFYATKIGNYWR